MLPKYLEAKKKHHYVWANYLARWGNGSKNVFYTTKKGKIAVDSVHGIAFENQFYEITTLTGWHIEVIKGFSRNSPDHLQGQHMLYLDRFLEIQQAEITYRTSSVNNREFELYIHALKCNALENLHASHERMATPVLAALAEDRFDILQDAQQMMGFMSFFGHQIARTKTFKDSVVQVLARRNSMEIAVADAMEGAWWFLSYMYGMNIGASLYMERHNAIHTLLINDTRVPFITSDQPIVNVHSCVSETEFVAPKNADFYFPISPRVAYIICDSERFQPGRHEVDEATLIELNTKVAAQAMVHIIGNSKDAILPFQKYIGRRYQKARTSVSASDQRS